MADYSRAVATALRVIQAKGGPCKFIISQEPATDDGDGMPWRDDDPAGPLTVDAYAVVIPFEGAQATARPFANQMLVGQIHHRDGSELILDKGMFFEDAAGITWQIKDLTRLAPDHVTTILWQCEVVQWPQRIG